MDCSVSKNQFLSSTFRMTRGKPTARTAHRFPAGLVRASHHSLDINCCTESIWTLSSRSCSGRVTVHHQELCCRGVVGGGLGLTHHLRAALLSSALLSRSLKATGAPACERREIIFENCRTKKEALFAATTSGCFLSGSITQNYPKSAYC